jgi:hypothetical protein
VDLPQASPGAEPGVATRMRLVAPYPNPTTGTTTIDFFVDHPSLLTLTLHDATGRLRAKLMEGRYSHGWHTALWHGVDADGRAVLPGTYYVRLRTPTGSRTAPLIIIH